MDSRACACPCPLGTGCIEASSQFQFRSGGLSRLTVTDTARGLRAARANTSSCSFDRLGFSACLIMVQAATLRWELEVPTHPTTILRYILYTRAVTRIVHSATRAAGRQQSGAVNYLWRSYNTSARRTYSEAGTERAEGNTYEIPSL